MQSRLVLAMLLVTGGHWKMAHAETAAPAFDVSDSLSINRILERPQVAPDGSAIAYLVGDWQNEGAIRAHKPLGQLLVRRRSDDGAIPLAKNASDPVWSRSADRIAFFEGLAEARELVVAGWREGEDHTLRFAIAGERSSYSARHFAPIWTRADQHIVVAEARHQNVPSAAGAPYTVTSETKRLPFDAHFRDDTLWRLVRIDPAAHERKVISPDIALREIHASPTGDRLILGLARSAQPGGFIGDRYVQPVEYWMLSVGADSPLRLVPTDGVVALLGWQDDRVLIARTSEGIAAIDVDASTTETVIRSPSVQSAAGFAVAGSHLAVWGPVADENRDAYLIPPPAPHELLVGDTTIGVLHRIVGANDNQEVVESVWLEPGDRLAVHTRRLDTLAERILLWTGDELHEALETASALGPIAVSGREDFLVFQAETGDGPPELAAFDLSEQRLEPLSRHNARFANAGFVSPILVTGETSRSQPWRALLYLPPLGETPGAEALVVHAYGRQTDGRHRFNAEAQMHVARGYAFLLPDVFPRRGALREAYADTLPAAVEEVRRDQGLRGKTGYLGGSLGGYAGLVLLSHSKVVDAAVLRAPPVEFALSWATGKDRDADLLEYLMLGQRPHQNPEAYRADSPFWMADRITAPTLFLHGSEDAQVPLSHSLWLFQSLRRMGQAPAELRVYPGADHSIVRGSHANYIDFYQQIFSWWRRYLDPQQP